MPPMQKSGWHAVCNCLRGTFRQHFFAISGNVCNGWQVLADNLRVFKGRCKLYFVFVFNLNQPCYPISSNLCGHETWYDTPSVWLSSFSFVSRASLASCCAFSKIRCIYSGCSSSHGLPDQQWQHDGGDCDDNHEPAWKVCKQPAKWFNQNVCPLARSRSCPHHWSSKSPSLHRCLREQSLIYSAGAKNKCFFTSAKAYPQS